MTSVGVAVAVLDRGRVLLVQREDCEMWCLPGGAVDQGESLAQAARREVREETGFDVRLTRLVGLYSRPDWGNHSAVFAAVVTGGTLVPDGRETLAATFVDPDALPPTLLWWYERPIRDALAGVTGAVWTLDVPWPFGPEVRTRQDLYDLRDRSGLGRLAFGQEHFTRRGPAGEVAELPGVPMPTRPRRASRPG